MEPAIKQLKKYSMFGIAGREMISNRKNKVEWTQPFDSVFLWQNKLPPTIQTTQS